MKRLIIEIELKLLPEPSRFNESGSDSMPYIVTRNAIMHDVSQYCEGLWIDDEYFATETDMAKIQSEKRSNKPVHTYRYLLKPDVDYIPREAFDSRYCHGAQINRIVIPDGIRTLKTYCFRNRKFAGDLILPDSVKRICMGAFDFCDIKGHFRIPGTVKHIGSIPTTEETKEEMFFPEGVVSLVVDRLETNHLHLPSTLREFRTRYSLRKINCFEGKPLITIAPENPYMFIQNGEIKNLYEGKREKLKQLERMRESSQLGAALGEVGLSYSFWYDTRTIKIPIHRCHNLFFPKAEWGTRSGLNRIINISVRLRKLFKENEHLSSMIDINREFNQLLNDPVLYQNEINLSLELKESVDNKNIFTVDLLGMGYPIVSEIKNFSQTLITTINELRKEFGPFHMELY